MDLVIDKELRRTFHAFKGGWDAEKPYMNDENSWVETWGSLLSEFSPECIRAVTDHSLESSSRCPVLFEFYKLCLRYSNSEDLSAPIVTKAEELAKQLLIAMSELEVEQETASNALMIAYSVMIANSYSNSNLELSDEAIEVDCAGRARMFGHEAKHWRDEAEHGRGYWVDVFNVTSDKK